MSEDPTEAAPLLELLRNEPDLAGYATFVFPKVVTLRSTGSLEDRSHELAVAIDTVWVEHGRPESVILTGHSLGGLMVRYAYLDARGEFRGSRQAWAQHVSRIVLFAAPNRGFDTHRLPVVQRWAASVALAVAPVTRNLTAVGAVKGAPFLSNMRIQWIRSFASRATDDAPPTVVQVLGTDDSSVSRDDSLDIETMPMGTTVEIPYANHRTVISPHPAHDDIEGAASRILVRG